MAFKPGNNPPDLSALLITLQQSDTIKKNPALFQTIAELIKRTASNISIIENQILAIEEIEDELVNLIKTATFLTATDQSAALPNSRHLIAGENVEFDDTVDNQRTINVPLEQTFLTEDNETTTLPNSRRVLAGSNISFDDSVANVRTINVSGGSANDYVVLSDGAVDVATMPINDGAGNFIYTPYTP